MTLQCPDHQIVDDILDGNEDSFQLLMQRYRERLTNAVTQVVGCPTDAEDIVQEAFVRGYLNLNRFRRQSSLLTWFYRIAMNLAFTHQRRQRRNVSLNDYPKALGNERHHDAEEPCDQLLREEECEELRAAIAKLDKRLREVLFLREMEGHDYKTIASLLNIPVGTVRIRLHRARLQLRGMLRTAETL